MASKRDAQNRVWYAVAGAVLLDALLIAPLLVVVFRFPSYAWWALGAYLVLSTASVAMILLALHRAGMLDWHSPVTGALRVFLPAFAVLTAALVGAVVWRPSLGLLWLALYLVATVYGIYLLVRWEARNLALQCLTCGTEFRVSATTWAFSPNMGTNKYVRCPQCGRTRLAKVVRPSAQARALEGSRR